MFYFTLNGARCGCDPVEELQAAVPGNSPSGGSFVAVKLCGAAPEWVGNAAEGLRKLLAEKEAPTSDEPVAKKRRHRKARKASMVQHAVAAVSNPKREARYLVNLSKTPQELKELPLVRGGVTWAITKRVGKKVGRTDFAQLRSDLAQRKKLG